MNAIHSHDLTCPSCGRAGKRGNVGISLFNADSGTRLAKCFRCDHVWNPAAREGRIATPWTLVGWARKRGIEPQAIESAPVALVLRTRERRDKSATFQTPYLAFKYPDGSIHWISVKKSTQTGRAFQDWEPIGHRHCTLWAWQNPARRIDDGRAYLCEGEKDALALGQLGFLVYAVPGASAMTSERSDWLIADLQANHPGVTAIRLCFDHDAAGEAGREKAIGMLAGRGFGIESLEWPDGTPEKADIGDICAKNHGQVPAILAAMVWVDAIAERAKHPVNEVIPGTGTQEEVIIPNFLVRYPDGYRQFNEKGDSASLSNCVIDIQRKYRGETGIEYAATLSGDGRSSGVIRIPASDFADASSLRRTCASHGPFHFWDLSIRQLAAISVHESQKSHVLEVTKIAGFGWDQPQRCYGFPGLIIAGGKIHRPDEDGLIRIGEETPAVFDVSSDYRFLGGRTPEFKVEETLDIPVVSYRLAQEAGRLIGKTGEYSGLLILGWFLAALVSDIPFTRKYGLDEAFPILMIYGKQESGKTSAVSLFHALHGYHAPTGDTWDGSTNDFFQKAMSANKNIAMWFEEAKTTGRISIDSIKTTFNRSSPGKGSKTGTRNLAANGTLVLTGEQPIHEILNRSILIEMPHATEREKRNAEAYLWLKSHREHLETIGVDLMRRRTADQDQFDGQFIHRFTSWSTRLRDFDLSDRVRHNYALALSGLSLLNCELNATIDFEREASGKVRDWFAAYIGRQTMAIRDADPVEQGLDDFLSQPDHDIYHVGDHILIPSSIGPWLRRLPNFDFRRFETALKTAPYYDGSVSARVVDGRRVRSHGGTLESSIENTHVTKVHRLKANHPQLPSTLKEVAIRYVPQKIGGTWELHTDGYV